ncbi:MAG: hypothetical protein L3K23_10855, partial [Thermoplasmata archaeon]|nr:hypothetical protein [Thermoplasmata archaeon]
MTTPRFVQGTPPGEIESQFLRMAAVVDTGDVDVKAIEGLPFIGIYNADTVAHTVTAKGRQSGPATVPSIPFSVLPGQIIPLGTTPFSSFSDAQANGNLYYWYSDVPPAGPSPAAGSGIDFPSGASITDNGIGGITFKTATGAIITFPSNGSWVVG